MLHKYNIMLEIRNKELEIAHKKVSLSYET